MSNIQVIALRSFNWSNDGYTSIRAEEKTVFDLPEKLFDGLNKIGYVRRAVIGDGHVSLRAVPEIVPADAGESSPDTSEADAPAAAIDDSEAPSTEAGTAAPSTTAPRPASATAPLDPEEIAALKSGFWDKWPFFKKRSVAAKLSGKPMNTSEDVLPVLRGEAERLTK